MVADEYNDAMSTIDSLRAAVALLGIRYQGLQLHGAQGVIQTWEGLYELPPEDQKLLKKNPSAVVRRVFAVQTDDENTSAVVAPLRKCSSELLQAVFDKDFAQQMGEASPQCVEFESRNLVACVALSDNELLCPDCGHWGMERIKSWPALCLEATRATSPSVDLTSHDLRPLISVTIVCPNCTHAQERPFADGLKERAMAVLVGDRMNLSLPVAAADLRSLLRKQNKTIYNTGEILWLSIKEFLFDLDDLERGTQCFRYDRFAVVKNDDLPPWMEAAMNQMEHLGWIENIAGDVFRKCNTQALALDPFAPPLIEHLAFPVGSLQ